MLKPPRETVPGNPVGVQNELVRHELGKRFLRIDAAIPRGRFKDVGDVAGPAVHLASEERGSTKGLSLRIDRGVPL